MKPLINKYFQTHPFSKIGLLAIPMLALVIIMEFYFPKVNPEGFQSFIVAFEFAKTPNQIHQLLNELDANTLKNINIGNYIDFGFMIAYTLFLVLFFKKAAKTFNKNWLLAGIPLSVIVLIADVIENILLFQITAMYSATIADADLIAVLNKLHAATWIKCGGLAIIFALFSVKSFGKKILTHIEGIVFVFPLLFVFWAISNDPIGVTRFTLSIALAFFLLLFYCFWQKTKRIEKLKKKFS